MSTNSFVAGEESISVSFEFFPPKSPEMEKQLWGAIGRLAPLRPAFVSVTYGAGGSTRDRTHATVKRIVEETEIRPAAHLTCVGASREEINEVIHDYWAAGVRHIVALRGDMPEPGAVYCAHTNGYQSTADLVSSIRAIADFDVSVAAYPEKHPDSASIEQDLKTLQKKIDAGASRAITQFVFDNEAIPRFRDRVVAAGINVPIVPGLMPTTNFIGTCRMAKRCGAHIPDWLCEIYEGLDDDLPSRKIIAGAILAEQVRLLLKEGFAQFHFYTLNQSELTFAVCNLFGIKPVKEAGI
jgi:methylenetetrahydrofolate reductase (NADPH)